MDKDMRFQAKLYIGMMVGAAGWAMFRAGAGWHSDDLLRFLCNLAVCILVSGLKVNLPGIKGTMSVNFLFILIGVSQMSLGETMALGMRRHPGAVHLEGQEPGPTRAPAVQRIQHGDCGYRLLRILRVASDSRTLRVSCWRRRWSSSL